MTPSGESSFAARRAKLDTLRVTLILIHSEKPTGVSLYKTSLNIQILRARAGMDCRKNVDAFKYEFSTLTGSCPNFLHGYYVQNKADPR